jgi:uncharacterized protein (TIGR00369 family)
VNGAGSIPATVVTTPLGRPEALFRVGAAEKDGEVVRAQMRTGPWTRGWDSGSCAGSLGVFLDDLLGNALIEGRPENYWPVSTELSIDLAAPLPAGGSVLAGRSWPVSVEAGGALSQGTVTDGSGAVIATATTRERYLPAPQSLPGGPGPGSGPPAQDDPGGPQSTMALLGAVARREGGAVIMTVPGSEDFANPMGNTHGGILLCASEIAGSLALDVDTGPLQTSSIRVVYARSVPVTDTITYTAQVLYRGRTLGTAQVTARGASGKTCAIAMITAHGEALVP